MKIKDLAVVVPDISARNICARKKNEIISDKVSTKHIGKPIFLCGDKIYGIIELNQPSILDKDFFKSHFKRHMVTDAAREELWPGEERLYAYSFRIKRIFKEPIDCEIKNQLGFVEDLEMSIEERRGFIKGVIGYEDYGKASEDTPWDGPEERRKATVEVLKKISAWYDSGKPDVKSSYKLPHHKAEGSHVAVWNGVRAAMAALLGARGGTNIPEADRKGVYNHLVKHYAQFDKEAPIYKSYNDEELEKMFPEFFKADILVSDKDFKKYYDELEKLENTIVAKKGYEDQLAILIKLYKAFIRRMEIRAYEKENSHYAEDGFTKAVRIFTEGNYIRARLRSPGSMVKGSFRTIVFSESRGIKGVIGRLKSDPQGPTHVQTVLFAKDRWTVASARAWIQEHRDTLKAMDYIKCEHCDNYFDYAAQPEVTMGFVNCPHCETTVNQKGK